MLGGVQQMIGIYDKGNKSIKRTFIGNIVDCPERDLEVCKELSELKKHNITIAHASDQDWQQLITDCSSKGNVRVRVTVDGTPFNEPPTDENGIYMFHLAMRARELSEEEWKAILSGLSDQKTVEDLVRGKDPDGLRRFFEHEVMEHLSALTILCEGYLAVHADSKNDHTDIKQALEEMKWPEFRKSDRDQILIQEDLGEKICEIQQPEWWSNVFGQESFYKDVKKEWENTTRTEEIPKALDDLLEMIRASDTVIPPKIVADAYCVLVKKKL